MSGRKQHFIPKKFLRGFGTPTRKSFQVKVHRFDSKPFVRLIDEVGAESEFYSQLSDNSDSKTLDDKITEYENEFYEHLDYLRDLDWNAVADPRVASEFVVHLATRNDHFRRATTAAAQEFFGTLTTKLRSESSARQLLGVSSEKPGRLFQETLAKELDKRPELAATTGLGREQLERMLSRQIAENFSEYHSNLAGPLKDAFAEVSGELREIGATAQRDALERELVPKLRVEKLARHTWTILQSETDLILPDCVAISAARGGMKVPLMLAEDTQIDEILIPLEKNRLMQGTSSSFKSKVDTKYINRHFSRCSWDFFVSDIEADTRKFQSQIRKNVRKVIENLTTSIFDQPNGL